MQLVEHTIAVTRDITQTVHRKAWDHEMPVLKVLHGSDNVSVLSSETIDYPGFNVSDEYKRLKAKYNRKDDGQHLLVERIYGEDAVKLAERLGVVVKAGTAIEKRSIQIDNRTSRVRGEVSPIGKKAEVVEVAAPARTRGRPPKAKAELAASA
tara:strand:+ start:58 stop:516 length:459 start_codon:yes stop_codon:yes gene_type:complete